MSIEGFLEILEILRWVYEQNNQYSVVLMIFVFVGYLSAHIIFVQKCKSTVFLFRFVLYVLILVIFCLRDIVVLNALDVHKFISTSITEEMNYIAPFENLKFVLYWILTSLFKFLLDAEP